MPTCCNLRQYPARLAHPTPELQGLCAARHATSRHEWRPEEGLHCGHQLLVSPAAAAVAGCRAATGAVGSVQHGTAYFVCLHATLCLYKPLACSHPPSAPPLQRYLCATSWVHQRCQVHGLPAEDQGTAGPGAGCKRAQPSWRLRQREPPLTSCQPAIPEKPCWMPDPWPGTFPVCSSHLAVWLQAGEHPDDDRRLPRPAAPSNQGKHVPGEGGGVGRGAPAQAGEQPSPPRHLPVAAPTHKAVPKRLT